MIDATHQIDDVERQVGSRTLPAGEARVVTVRQTYATTVEDLWHACTDIERLPRWLMPVSGDLRLGGRYQLEGNAGGTIESCEPPHRFTATWEYGDEITWIDVRITEVGNGAQLQVDHIAHVDAERWLEFGPGAVGVGWDMMLLGLALHVRSGGRSINRDEVAAWLPSPDGIAFAVDSSERWRQASVAAGTPEDEARAAADRTTTAYTAYE